MRSPSVRPESLADRVARLEALVARLVAQTGRQPRDEADRALLATLAAVAGDEAFRAADIFRVSELDADLKAALEETDTTTPLELGHWLARMEAVHVAGLRLARQGRDRSGQSWRFEVTP
jgi:hypothetical protein